MPRILLLEGNTAEKRAAGEKLGIRSSSGIYREAILRHFPDLALDVVNGADPDWSFPEGRSWPDYDGLVITGSALHAYDREFAVTNQIALVSEAGAIGLPIFGSCWGLQIAAMASGGRVEYNARGREVGIARKIVPNERGRAHPIFAAKGPAFDAPCIHSDEVTSLPKGSELLASNDHSTVQAALIPVGKSIVWAVQYHPEYDLAQLIALYRLYAEDMIRQGFFLSEEDMRLYLDKLDQLAADPSDVALRWQFGIDDDILDDKLRNAEIIAWIECEILPRG